MHDEKKTMFVSFDIKFIRLDLVELNGLSLVG